MNPSLLSVMLVFTNCILFFAQSMNDVPGSFHTDCNFSICSVLPTFFACEQKIDEHALRDGSKFLCVRINRMTQCVKTNLLVGFECF